MKKNLGKIFGNIKFSPHFFYQLLLIVMAVKHATSISLLVVYQNNSKDCLQENSSR
jgi:hypothetical protein